MKALAAQQPPPPPPPPPQQQQQQLVVEKGEEGDKEKKKKRRSNRRSKHSSAAAAGCSSVDGTCGHASACSRNGSNSNGVTSHADASSSKKHEVDIHASDKRGVVRASNIAFNSLPSMHIAGEAASGELANMQDHYPFRSDVERDLLIANSRSYPLPISNERMNIALNREGYSDLLQRKHYLPYLLDEAVNEAIEKGDAFRATFRVNAHNRLEAYCTLDGVPTDILISGVHAQNRAIEGDIVAVALDPVASWPKLKGSAGRFCNSNLLNDSDGVVEVIEVVGDRCKGRDRVDSDCLFAVCRNGLLPSDEDYKCSQKFSGGTVHLDMEIGHTNSNYQSNGCLSYSSDPSDRVQVSQQVGVEGMLGKLAALVSAFPSKRPTGRVVAIIERSSRRDAVVGFLGVKQWLSYKEGYKKETGGQLSKRTKNFINFSTREFIQLTPSDARFPKMMVSVRSLPEFIQERLKKGDVTVEMELVAARVDDWKEESFLPQAQVMHVFGRGGEIEPHIAAILFENAICTANFSPESLACLPDVPWQVPVEELKRRKDLRDLCIFTIDPSTATDLDDALSVERISDDIFRVGVHIADVSFFVSPDTGLDVEAKVRSTSVYLLQHKIPMLPPLLSEDLVSLLPGVDRLAVSIVWDINLAGNIVNRWIGHTVIRSCCKLSYEHAQGIIDGLVDAEMLSSADIGYPELHGRFDWHDVVTSVRMLHEISKKLKDNRFKDGALWLETCKLVFVFDEFGIPCDSIFYEQKDSNYLVEEFMLLANRMAAEVISKAFPDCALLRRHPKPNLRKLKEFEAFCSRHGLELDTSSSRKLQLSLRKIREHLRNDPVLYDILVSYASRPMQSASYFCTGDLRDREHDWAHYSLAVPIYTHFTSPLRRYPDIIVHRTLTAALEAEEMCMHQQMTMGNGNAFASKFFTCFHFDKDALESKVFRDALSVAAAKHRVPGAEALAEVVSHCNERNLASKHAEDAGEKVYLWAMLKKKEMFITDARVLGLGPKFMSIYIHKLAMERRIYYDEVEGLIVEWLETTSTLVLDIFRNKRLLKKSNPGKYRSLEDVAWVVNPYDLSSETAVCGSSIENGDKVEDENSPAVFPLTLQLQSSVPVVLHAVGGDGNPLDIGARLYLSSYFR